MKRDFSNSKRKKLKEILENNKNYFNSGNVSGEVLFSSQEASGEDYSQYYDEVESCVIGANSTYQYSGGQVDELIQEIDTVFDAAQKIDEEYVDVVEGNITLTTDNFITDLKTLELALDVSGANEISVDNLEDLAVGDMGSVFGNTKDFKEQLKDVDNPLYEEFLARFVTSSGVEYDEISKFAEENMDELSAWELQVFETILNSYIDPDTGEVDAEGVGKFIKAFYYYVPYDGSGYQEYYLYQLHDEYAQIYEYHMLHTDVANDVALGENAQNGTTNNSVDNLSELLKKVYLYGQEIQIPMYPKDEEHGGWCSTPVVNELDLDIINAGDTNIIVYHSAGGDNSAKKIQSVLDGIDISYTNPESRFGQGFYVAEDGNTTVAELAYHGLDAEYSIRYEMNLEGQKVLDLTDPNVASEWGFVHGESSIQDCHNIAEAALDEGYNVIKVYSYRDEGINYVIYDNFDEILQPQMVTPVGE